MLIPEQKFVSKQDTLAIKGSLRNNIVNLMQKRVEKLKQERLKLEF